MAEEEFSLSPQRNYRREIDARNEDSEEHTYSSRREHGGEDGSQSPPWELPRYHRREQRRDDRDVGYSRRDDRTSPKTRPYRPSQGSPRFSPLQDYGHHSLYNESSSRDPEASAIQKRNFSSTKQQLTAFYDSSVARPTNLQNAETVSEENLSPVNLLPPSQKETDARSTGNNGFLPPRAGPRGRRGTRSRGSGSFSRGGRGGDRSGGGRGRGRGRWDDDDDAGAGDESWSSYNDRGSRSNFQNEEPEDGGDNQFSDRRGSRGRGGSGSGRGRGSYERSYSRGGGGGGRFDRYRDDDNWQKPRTVRQPDAYQDPDLEGDDEPEPEKPKEVTKPKNPEPPQDTEQTEESSEPQWWYKDPGGHLQGPFPSSDMKNWYESGYFDLKLKIACDIDPNAVKPSQFSSLGAYFLDGKSAFLDSVPDITATVNAGSSGSGESGVQTKPEISKVSQTSSQQYTQQQPTIQPSQSLHPQSQYQSYPSQPQQQPQQPQQQTQQSQHSKPQAQFTPSQPSTKPHSHTKEFIPQSASTQSEAYYSQPSYTEQHQPRSSHVPSSQDWTAKLQQPRSEESTYQRQGPSSDPSHFQDPSYSVYNQRISSVQSQTRPLIQEDSARYLAPSGRSVPSAESWRSQDSQHQQHQQPPQHQHHPQHQQHQPQPQQQHQHPSQSFPSQRPTQPFPQQPQSQSPYQQSPYQQQPGFPSPYQQQGQQQPHPIPQSQQRPGEPDPSSWGFRSDNKPQHILPTSGSIPVARPLVSNPYPQPSDPRVNQEIVQDKRELSSLERMRQHLLRGDVPEQPAPFSITQPRQQPQQPQQQPQQQQQQLQQREREQREREQREREQREREQREREQREREQREREQREREQREREQREREQREREQREREQREREQREREQKEREQKEREKLLFQQKQQPQPTVLVAVPLSNPSILASKSLPAKQSTHQKKFQEIIAEQEAEDLYEFQGQLGMQQKPEEEGADEEGEAEEEEAQDGEREEEPQPEVKEKKIVPAAPKVEKKVYPPKKPKQPQPEHKPRKKEKMVPIKLSALPVPQHEEEEDIPKDPKAKTAQAVKNVWGSKAGAPPKVDFKNIVAEASKEQDLEVKHKQQQQLQQQLQQQQARQYAGPVLNWGQLSANLTAQQQADYLRHQQQVIAQQQSASYSQPLLPLPQPHKPLTAVTVQTQAQGKKDFKTVVAKSASASKAPPAGRGAPAKKGSASGPALLPAPIPGLNPKVKKDPKQTAKDSKEKKSGSGAKVSNVFGGPQMSAEFETWCKKQLAKIPKSNGDISLAHYLMTLDNPTTIRETITQYLGEGQAVTEFADGFLQNKGFETGKNKSKPPPATGAASPQPAKAISGDNGGFQEPSSKKSRRKKKK